MPSNVADGGADETAMAVAGIGAINDRIGKIASQIAEIEHRNPLSRSASSTTGTKAPATANAFKQHLASQTMQSMAGALGATQGSAGGGSTSLGQAGLAGASLGALGQGISTRTAVGGAGLNPSLLSGAGVASPVGGAVQALAALLQAGAQSQGVATEATPAGATQTQPFLPLAGAVTNQGQRSTAARTPGADPLTNGIASLPKGTHPAIPERRSSKVPTELTSFGNGKIPADQLESVGVKDHQLWSPAAKAFKLMRAAAQRDGVQIGVNSSYRDVACQQCMVDKYGIYGQGGRAAPPGKSNHGWGLSIDLQLDESAKKWMRANAKHYGFVEDVAREPWHWTFIADGNSVQTNTQALMR